MVTFTCDNCGNTRTLKVKRCYPCTASPGSAASNARRIATMTGAKHSSERRAAISAGQRNRTDVSTRFDLAAHYKGRHGGKWLDAGTERLQTKGRYMVKCADGKWRYRARLVWEKANGPIPKGQLIHHRNGDATNDDISNLQLVTRSAHLSIHRH